MQLAESSCTAALLRMHIHDRVAASVARHVSGRLLKRGLSSNFREQVVEGSLARSCLNLKGVERDGNDFLSFSF